MQEMQILSLDQKDPCRRQWQSTTVFLPVKSLGQRSLAGCSAWGHIQLNMGEWLNDNNNVIN